MEIGFAPMTAPPTGATATAAALAPRATTDSCLYGINELAQCTGGINSCIVGLAFGGQTSGYMDQYTSCYCREGPGFLDCYFSGLNAKGCTAYGGVTNWQDYQMDWFASTCGSVPASIQAKMTPPSSVRVDFTTVSTVRITRTTTTRTTSRTTSSYTGSGTLLAGPCKSTSYILVDQGATVYWAPFIGCVSDRPECCPWVAATTAALNGGGTAIPTNITSDTTITMTTTSTIGGGGNTVGGPGATNNGQIAAFPSAADAAQQILKRCPDDYYSYSGGCCPNGYWPFTSAIGGQTPCWSSTTRQLYPPAITVTDGLEAGVTPSSTPRTSSTSRNGTTTSTSSTSTSAKGADGKPTSAVVNIVWAVQYAVEPGSGSSGGSGLSTGAIAGIAVGAVVAVAAIAVLAFFLLRSRRKNRALTIEKAGAAAVVTAPAQSDGAPTVVPSTGAAPMQPGMQPPMATMMPQQQQQYYQPSNGQQPMYLDPNAPAGTTRSATVSSISSAGTGAALMHPMQPSSHSHSGTTSPGHSTGEYPAPISEESGYAAGEPYYVDPTQQQAQGGMMVPLGTQQPAYYYPQQQPQPQGMAYPQQHQEQMPQHYHQPQQAEYTQPSPPQPSTSPAGRNEGEAGRVAPVDKQPLGIGIG